MVKFYSESSGEIYMSDDDECWLSENGVYRICCDRFDSTDLKKIFYHPARSAVERTLRADDAIISPLPENESLLIAGSILDIEKDYASADIKNDIEDIDGSKYILSAIPEVSGCFSFRSFSYEIFSRFITGNLTTPFCILDESFSWCVFWDFDLEYTAITRSKDCLQLRRTFSNISFDQESFLRSYKEFIPRNQRHEEVLRKYILPNVTPQ